MDDAPPSSPDLRIALRDALARTAAQACGMAHETLPRGPDGHPLPGHETGTYRRAPLCAASRRRRNLACCHTAARHALRDALRFLSSDDPCGSRTWEAALLRFDAIDADLGRLDHRRYHAETALADALTPAEEQTAQAALANALADHAAHVAALDDLRKEVLDALKRGIEPAMPTQPASTRQLKIAS